jgi:hypothetical protein
MTKRADTASSVDRLVWRRFIKLLQAHFPSPVSSRVLKTLGFLAAAVVSAEICSHASAPNRSDNFPPDEVLANTEILPAPAPTSVSLVPKMPRLLSQAASQAVPLGLDIATTNVSSEPSLPFTENVSSMILMAGYSMVPTSAAATATGTPCAVIPKPKLKPKPKPARQEQQAVQEAQPKLSWWRRLPWIPLP